jgi:hypothetical protein
MMNTTPENITFEEAREIVKCTKCIKPKTCKPTEMKKYLVRISGDKRWDEQTYWDGLIECQILRRK